MKHARSNKRNQVSLRDKSMRVIVKIDTRFSEEFMPDF